jgi:hypothetical protein
MSPRVRRGGPLKRLSPGGFPPGLNVVRTARMTGTAMSAVLEGVVHGPEGRQ